MCNCSTLTLSFLDSLALNVNIPKSHLMPSHRVKFIGAEIDTTVCRAYLPRDRVLMLIQAAHKVSGDESVSALQIRLLGFMLATVAVLGFA